MSGGAPGYWGRGKENSVWIVGSLLRVLAFRQRRGGTDPSQDWANEEGALMESHHGDSWTCSCLPDVVSIAIF